MKSTEFSEQSAPAAETLWRAMGTHAPGILALVWAGATWTEWFLIPVLYPADGGPVPHLAFAPQALLLFLGCVATVVVIPIWAFNCRGRAKFLFAFPAAAYVMFQLWRAI